MHVIADLSLAPQNPQSQSSDASQTQPPPQFEAAGVRGLIDPGGYSVPADAAAASGLIKGIADIKREDRYPGESTADSLPCGLEPGLIAAVEANPGSAAAAEKLGNFYVVHDQPEKAIPLLAQAHRFDRSDVEIVKDLAIAQLQTGQFDAARQLLAPFAETQKDATLYQLLARADEGSGMFAKASREYQTAAALQPSEESFFGAGYELILAGSPVEAAHAFQSGIAAFPKSIELLIGAGTAEFLKGDRSAGVLYFLRATDLDPADPRPYQFLASASGIPSGESYRIRDKFKQYLEIAPENPDASFYYALSLWDLRGDGLSASDMNAIEQLLKRAIQLKPEFAKAHFQLAALYFEREDYAGAAREYEATLRLDPQLKEAHYRLAGAYQHTGQKALAAQQLQLFQEERSRQSTQAGGSSISIEQFVSVAAPRGQRNAPSASCSRSNP
ncbi:MAG: tetratricopeptide repeat protein [Candidatus Acidiferrales bacterium]